MLIASRIDEVRSIVRRVRGNGDSVGLVPTMGALHEGHSALIRRARQTDDFVVVSIFVNPTQFGPSDDFGKYPRQLDKDAAVAEELGVDLVFAPTAEEMYSPDSCTYVEVGGLTEELCGAFRPEHFRGVTTVVSKLLNIVSPDRAYFGQKDYQQLLVIERMTRDLDMPVEIVACPTVREADGLAVSSRNKYLTPEQRSAAPAIYQALQKGAEAVRGDASAKEAEEMVAAHIENEPLLELQYARAVDPRTLAAPGSAGPPMLLAVAAFAGDTRLIDNIVVEE